MIPKKRVFKIYSIKVPVVDPYDLIKYKTILGYTRAYQNQDVAAVKNWIKENE